MRAAVGRTTVDADCIAQPTGAACPVAPADAALQAGIPWLWLIVVAVLTVIAVVLLGLWLTALRRERRLMIALDEERRIRAQAQSRTAAAETALHRATRPADGAPSGFAGAPPVSGFDRDLADQVIELADLATAPAVAAQASRVLRHLGVEALPAQVGEPLDPQRHLVVGSAPTADPQQDERVSAVVRPGWVRGGIVLRPASVTVWVAS